MSRQYLKIKFHHDAQWAGDIKSKHVIHGIAIQKSHDNLFSILGIDSPELVCAEDMGLGNLTFHDMLLLQEGLNKFLGTTNEQQ